MINPRIFITQFEELGASLKKREPSKQINGVGEIPSEDKELNGNESENSSDNNQTDADKRFVGVKFLMNYLDCPEPTLRDWIRLKKIPFFKMGKLIRFDLQRIDQWLKEKAVDK